MHCHGSYLPMSEARSAPHACSLFAFHPPLPDSQIDRGERELAVGRRPLAGRWARHRIASSPSTRPSTAGRADGPPSFYSGQ
eukprot:scaffold2383_cov143-Skeletonema_menzelii.AAC.5